MMNAPTSNGMAEHSRKALRCTDCRGFTMMSTCDFISGSNLGGIGVHRLSTAEREIEQMLLTRSNAIIFPQMNLSAYAVMLFINGVPDARFSQWADAMILQ